MIIAIDFDGTIVQHRYPAIGEQQPGAFMYLKKLQEDGHKLILWTVREGILLDEAVKYCEENGVRFYAVNKDYPEEKSTDEFYSRKLKVDLFIDDRNLGGLPGWEKIYKQISSGKAHESNDGLILTEIEDEHAAMMSRYQKGKKRGLLGKLFN